MSFLQEFTLFESFTLVNLPVINHTLKSDSAPENRFANWMVPIQLKYTTLSDFRAANAYKSQQALISVNYTY